MISKTRKYIIDLFLSLIIFYLTVTSIVAIFTYNHITSKPPVRSCFSGEVFQGLAAFTTRKAYIRYHYREEEEIQTVYGGPYHGWTRTIPIINFRRPTDV